MLLEEEKAGIVISILICIFGLIGNALLFFLIFILKEYKKSVTHWYIFQLAISDTLFLLTIPFTVVSSIYGNWSFGTGMCKLVYGIHYINYYVSIFLLLVMSFDRYLAVCNVFSQRLQKLRSQLSTHVISMIVWIISILFSIPIIHSNILKGIQPHCHCVTSFFSDNEEVEKCLKDHPGNETYCNPKPNPLDEGRCRVSIGRPNNSNTETEEFEENAIDYRENARDYGENARDYGENARDYGENARDYGENAKDYAENARDYREIARDYGENATDYGENANVYSDYYPQYNEDYEKSNWNSTFNGLHSLDDIIGIRNGSDHNMLEATENSLIQDYEDFNLNLTPTGQHPLWESYVWFNFIVLFVFPIVVISICYGLIVRKFIHSQVKLDSSSKNFSSNQEQKRLVIFCFTLVTTFFLCWIMFHITSLYELYHHLDPKVGEAAAILAFLNSALNPYLYILLVPGCQRKLKMVRESSVSQSNIPMNSPTNKITSPSYFQEKSENEDKKLQENVSQEKL